MRLWQRWFNDRGKREQWDAELSWFRLRYRDPDGPTRALTLLSRPRSAGRLALFFRPGPEVSRLHVGVPEPYAATLKQMAADFAFSLQPADHEMTLPVPGPLAPVEALPWERPFVAHIADGQAFAGALDGASDGESGEGCYLPAPADDTSGAPSWRLPSVPPVGLTTEPSWNGQGPPAASMTAAGGWPLGWSRDGTPLSAPGRVNVYGEPEAVASWLLPLVLHSLARDPAGLVVVDGAGDLVPRLKRKPQVTRLLGRGLTYINLDGPPVAGGFNPLATVPGETEAERLARWQHWFASLGVHAESLPLLDRAMATGVADLPALQRWLQRPAQQQHPTAGNLELTLRRLLSAPEVREWLSWPANSFAHLHEGTLLLACPSHGWPGTAILRSALLATAHRDTVRLVTYGIPWTEAAPESLHHHPRLVVGNGPLLGGSTVILARTHGSRAHALTGRFLGHDARQEENLQLLGKGETIVAYQGHAVPLSWHAKASLDVDDGRE